MRGEEEKRSAALELHGEHLRIVEAAIARLLGVGGLAEPFAQCLRVLCEIGVLPLAALPELAEWIAVVIQILGEIDFVAAFFGQLLKFLHHLALLLFEHLGMQHLGFLDSVDDDHGARAGLFLQQPRVALQLRSLAHAPAEAIAVEAAVGPVDFHVAGLGHVGQAQLIEPRDATAEVRWCLRGRTETGAAGVEETQDEEEHRPARSACDPAGGRQRIGGVHGFVGFEDGRKKRGRAVGWVGDLWRKFCGWSRARELRW